MSPYIRLPAGTAKKKRFFNTLVELLGFTSGHVEVVGVEQFEAEQRQYTLHGEGAAVDEVSVEEVGVALRGRAVQLEDVEQVVELAVDVAADGELVLVRDRDVHQRGLLQQVLLHLQQDLQQVHSHSHRHRHIVGNNVNLEDFDLSQLLYFSRIIF